MTLIFASEIAASLTYFVALNDYMETSLIIIDWRRIDTLEREDEHGTILISLFFFSRYNDRYQACASV